MSIGSSNNFVLLSENEIDEVNGAFLANIGMGVVGAASWMGAYAMSGWFSWCWRSGVSCLN